MVLTMEIESGVRIEDELLRQLVECGRQAHYIARAHDNDPGSNGHTFGLDRYHRGTELAKPPLKEYGFQVTRRGAGLVARRGDLELQFAVARGDDLTNPANFDAGSSPARRRAGQQNAAQLVLDGMPELEEARVVHVVWCGTATSGLTSAHVGSLVSDGADRLIWSALVRIDAGAKPVEVPREQPASGVPTYLEQPEPSLDLAPKTAGVADEA